MTPVRVLAVDDHPIVLEGLVRFAAVEPGLEVIATLQTLEDIGPTIDELAPDVLSVDVQVPGMEGPGTVRALAERGVPILLFTLLKVNEALGALVQAGARGYLRKSSSMADYLEAVRALRSGERWLPPELEAMAEQPVQSPSALLTPRELEIFRHLAKGESVKETAFTLGLSASTVYNHFDRIRKKLGVSSIAELVQLGAKWRFGE